ncbi:MAG: GerMN domain-containing protein [Ilumatobacteraceae bacterium]
MRRIRTALVAGLLAAVVSCTSGAETTTSSTIESTTTAPTTTAPTTTAPTTATPTSETAQTTVPVSTTSSTSASQTTTTDDVALTDVKVYFLRGERLAVTHRTVAGPAVLHAALDELMAGPTGSERTSGLTTSVPAGTQLRSVNLADGIATIDLSDAFDDGGGTLSMTTRLAQVVFTATQFDNVDRTTFRMNGVPIDALGGEGLALDQPQARMDMDRTITGSVIIDEPAPGSTVRSPFTVSGEGDVYEGQFPIEVWADGRQIGGVAPVWAGAWGNWEPFDTTITLSDWTGPIEIVAYDPGGCGTDPECPEIIRTVVEVTLAR